MSRPEKVWFKVNGRSVKTIEPRATLSDCVRPIGSRVGCDQGACRVNILVGGGAGVRSCRIFAGQADGMQITRFEEPSDCEALSAPQEALPQHRVLQSGFCRTGILTPAYCLMEESAVDADPIREELSRNVCRRSGYVQFIEAKACATYGNVRERTR